MYFNYTRITSVFIGNNNILYRVHLYYMVLFNLDRQFSVLKFGLALFLKVKSILISPKVKINFKLRLFKTAIFTVSDINVDSDLHMNSDLFLPFFTLNYVILRKKTFKNHHCICWYLIFVNPSPVGRDKPITIKTHLEGTDLFIHVLYF